MKIQWFWGLLLALHSVGLAGQAAAQALEIKPLSGDFYVFTTYQSYAGTPYPANGLYVLTQQGVVLIDSPWDTTQCQPLLDSIRAKHGKEVVLCLATHSHSDRTGGLDFFKRHGIATYTSRLTDSICQIQGEHRAAFTFDQDTTFQIGQQRFRAFYGGPGHTIDNIVVWFEQEKVLYGGCLIKSTESPDLGYIAEANLTEWPATLRRIQQQVGRPRFVIPGHQGWSNRKSVEHTLRMLRQANKKNARK
ncbi:MAG: BlaB/IND/MUS family subclass B1 metallo-beta-lactamase [Saprospiraceae bacterium]|nr:BlaB/IND/MUS family subclass B1 metallo-beta-lactamase [Saprospiraceae bacterium]